MDHVHDYGLRFFGTQFLEAEEARPFESRHLAVQWMHTLVAHLQAHRSNAANPKGESRKIGAGGAWNRLAYDLLTVNESATLGPHFRRRLLNPKTFQASRHELKVAAMWIAAGFSIEFENERDNRTSHAEFVATHRYLPPIKVAVEAKSRHRKGVQGFMGGRDIEPGATVNIRNLVLDGFNKKTALPLYLFVDANLPPYEDGAVVDRWAEEIDRTLKEDLSAEGYGKKCPANVVFFMNDPSHYRVSEEVEAPGNDLWIKDYVAFDPRVPHPTLNSFEIVRRLQKAHGQRATPPRDFPDFEIW